MKMISKIAKFKNKLFPSVTKSGFFVIGMITIISFLITVFILIDSKNALIEASKSNVQASGIILGFSFIAIATMFKDFKNRNVKFILKWLLNIVYNFTIVLVFGIISIWISSLYGTYLENIIILFFSISTAFVIIGSYSLIRFILEISKLL